MLKKLKLSGKLWGLTGLLLFAILCVAGVSIWSIRGILVANQAFSDAAEFSTFLAKKEVDHLNWVNQVKDLFVNNLDSLEVIMDPTQCGLGKFLYGEQAAALAQKFPDLAGDITAIKAPHQHLHETAREINGAWRKNHPGLSLTLAARLDDHRRWAANLADSLLENKAITVQLDPTQCAFGKWLAGDENRRLEAAWPEFGRIIAQISEHHEKLHASAARAKAAATEAEKRDVYRSETLRELESVGSLFQQVQNMEHELERSQAAAMQVFDAATIPALQQTKEKMTHLVVRFDEMKTAAKQAMISKGDVSRWFSMSVTAAIFVFGILLSFYLIRSITRPIFRIIEGLNEGSDQVASASSQVSSSSQQLAAGASEQAASIEETSSSLEEMASMTKQNAENAQQADSLMKSSHQVVVQANDSMTQLTTSMEDISKASQETSKIIKTIDEIAFQTNLLALNAAVEAARAGEAGAGFAVVADEVRNLAMRAADAARTTADLIESTVARIKDGGNLVSHTNGAFAKVTESTSRVGELVAEIAAASREQAQGIGQVNTAVAEMDKVVQQNAAGAEESASASEELNAQALHMKHFVEDLVALVGSGKNGRENRLFEAKMAASQTMPVRSAAIVERRAAKHEKPAAGKNAEKVRPEEAIPFDDAFTDF